ncbi:MAG: PIN domain-containing protein [Filimonas sp.]|nr:PIN domain-containing protein [Filimonas sp.]
MNGNKFLLDTHIILLLLNGDEVLSQLCDDSELCMSVVSEMELREYIATHTHDHAVIHHLLKELSVLGLTDELTKITTAIQAKYKMLLPDSLLAATAIAYNCPLVTSDEQFSKITELTLIYYDITSQES